MTTSISDAEFCSSDCICRVITIHTFDYQQAVVVEAPSVDTSDFMNNTTNITATGKYYTQQEKVNPNDLLYPRFLSLEFRSKPRQFVHIGKAGGSAIRIMVKKSKNKCSELSMQKNIVPDPVEAQVCALSKILSGQVHLKARLEPRKYYDPHTQFLINLRDPIDRLFSWYYYEIACFQQEKSFTRADQPGQASHNFRRLTQECYPEGGFVKMVRDGLLSRPSTRKKAPTPGAVETCDELARLCLRGDIMCFAHNYYNYEVYLEEILLRKGLSSNSHYAENIRVDALRSEFSMQDLNTTVGLWMSSNPKEYEQYAGVTPFVQSLYGRVRTIGKYDKSAGKKKPDLLNAEDREALCKHICTELIVYKKAIRAADNLDEAATKVSYDALDEKCGFEVDAVCGTKWNYRNVKAEKKIFSEAPW